MLSILLVASAASSGPLYPHLAAEINGMAKEDQAVRDKWIAEPTGSETESSPIIRQMRDVDHKDTERMKWIVREFGWPTPEMVGAEAANNAWLLVQHADADRPFQKKCLALIEPLAKSHVIEGRYYAYLFDRVQTGDGKLQRFGTQGAFTDKLLWISPVADPRRVDADRKLYGLEPLEEYAKGLAELYKKQLAPDWRARLIQPKAKR